MAGGNSEVTNTILFWTAIVQAVVSVLLVSVTSWYVWLTRKISRSGDAAAEAARRSTEVSLQVLAEMQEQRFDSSQPLIVPSIESHRNYNGIPESVEVSFMNVGNGPALVVSAAFRLGDILYVPTERLSRPVVVIQSEQGHQKDDRLKGQFVADRANLLMLVEHQNPTIEGLIDIHYDDVFQRHFHISVPITYNHLGAHLAINGLAIKITNTNVLSQMSKGLS